MYQSNHVKDKPNILLPFEQPPPGKLSLACSLEFGFAFGKYNGVFLPPLLVMAIHFLPEFLLFSAMMIGVFPEVQSRIPVKTQDFQSQLRPEFISCFDSGFRVDEFCWSSDSLVMKVRSHL
jgi:hypothetical protein